MAEEAKKMMERFEVLTTSLRDIKAEIAIRKKELKELDKELLPMVGVDTPEELETAINKLKTNRDNLIKKIDAIMDEVDEQIAKIQNNK